RAGRARAGPREHRLLAARQRSRLLAAALGEHREVFVDLGVVVGETGLGPSRVGPEAQVLLDREVHERPAPLRRVGDAEPHDVLGGLAVDALAVEAHLAAGLDHPADRAKRRGLAGPVGPEDRGDAAGLDLEGEALEHLGPPVLRLEVDGLQKGGHQRSPPRYALITSGSRCTVAGGPSAIFRPKSSTTTRTGNLKAKLPGMPTTTPGTAPRSPGPPPTP